MNPTFLIIVLGILVLFGYHVQSLKIGISKTQSEMLTTVGTGDAVTATEIYSESTLIPSTSLKPTIDMPTTTVPNILKIPEFPPKKPLPTAQTSTTTQKSTTSMTTFENEATDKHISNNSTSIYHFRSSYYFCNCNLLTNSCDVNCCCDSDCSYDALTVFKCFSEPADKIELERRLYDFQYQHGLPSCKLNDGWLCVFRTNIRRKQEQETFLEAHFDTNTEFKWTNPQLDNNLASKKPLRNYYQFDEKLQLLYVAKPQIETLKLPFAYVPPHCSLLEPISYLKNYESSCLVTSLQELQEHTKRLSDIVTQSKLLISPRELPLEDDTLDTELLLGLNLHVCKRVDRSKTMCNMATADTWNNSVYMDFNNTYIERVIFKIVHNFTNPLAIVLIFHELEIPDMDEIALWQHYEVQFLYLNNTEVSIEDALNVDLQGCRSSGPLGYIQGKPIIVAKLLPQDEMHNGEILNYFHESSCSAMHFHHTLRVFTKEKGICMPPTETTNTAIRYGINMHNRCKVHMQQIQINATSNYTALCAQLQQHINRQLLGAVDGDMSFEQMSTLYISTLGKPENDTAQWLQLKLNHSNEEFRPILGELHAHTSSFTCHNMLISAAYEFHIGHFMIHNVRHQAVVRHAILDMGKYHDLEFDLNEKIEVPISITVMFYNLNSNIVLNNAGGMHVNALLCITLSTTLIFFKIFSFKKSN